MRTAWAILCGLCLLGCGDDGDPGGSSGTTALADTGGSSTGAPSCEAPSDCATCWQCARAGACKTEYDACASNIDCAGSLACIDYMCPTEGLTQACFDHCCQNCAEHFSCGAVDAAAACIQQTCGSLCMNTAACGG